MMRGRRPTIFRVGHVHDNGHTIHVTGWGIGLCASNCNCHRDPDTHQLTAVEDQARGTLGLARHGGPCNCCSPWTADELAAIVRDLADISALMAQT